MLAKILSQKRRELERIDFERGIKKIRKSLPQLDETRSLTRSLAEEEGISLIAEIKRRSPSKGLLAPDLDVEKTTSSYEKAGAKAISVLTEKNFFDGSFQDLELAHECTRLPILRKDFILEEFQVWESRYLGADAILLIVAILDPEKLRRFHSLARQIGLEVLVEVHTEEELGEGLKAGSEMVGINNRNLETFEVNGLRQ
jgi:indole-3-glycerol phosphate synthase